MTVRAPDTHILLHHLANFIFRLAGWQAEGALPDLPKMVIVAAPHTSNWDGVLLFVVMFIYRVRLRWMGKESLFRGPFGWFSQLMGGIAVDRDAPRGAVQQMVNAFEQHQRLVLLITPEGTRQKVTRWKTGFYYIAQGADVPIVLAYVDYPRKRVGIGPVFEPSGDIDVDMARVQAFYADKVGKFPQMMTEAQP
jgi:1-acyl-sn-glycerol-3-phosphate acyltransferase